MLVVDRNNFNKTSMNSRIPRLSSNKPTSNSGKSNEKTLMMKSRITKISELRKKLCELDDDDDFNKGRVPSSSTDKLVKIASIPTLPAKTLNQDLRFLDIEDGSDTSESEIEEFVGSKESKQELAFAPAIDQELRRLNEQAEKILARTRQCLSSKSSTTATLINNQTMQPLTAPQYSPSIKEGNAIVSATEDNKQDRKETVESECIEDKQLLVDALRRQLNNAREQLQQIETELKRRDSITAI